MRRHEIQSRRDIELAKGKRMQSETTRSSRLGDWQSHRANQTEDYVKIVKGIPENIIGGLKEKDGTSGMKKIIENYGKSNPYNQTFVDLNILGSHLENITKYRKKKDIPDQGKIPEMLKETNKLLTQLDIKHQGVQAFHNYLKSQLGEASPADLPVARRGHPFKGKQTISSSSADETAPSSFAEKTISSSSDDEATSSSSDDETPLDVKNPSEADYATIVKNIPQELFDGLYYSTKKNPRNENAFTKRYPNDVDRKKLKSHTEILEGFKRNGSINAIPNDLKETLLEAQQLLNKLDITHSGVQAFHSYLKSQLKNLG